MIPAGVLHGLEVKNPFQETKNTLVLRRGPIIRGHHLLERARRPNADGGGVGDGEDERGASVDEVEAEAGFAGDARLGPGAGAPRRDADEEDEHASAVNVVRGFWVA